MIRLIINRPDLQSFQQKYGQGLLTIFFWVLFFFFLRPLIGLVGWFFGIQLFTDVMIVKGGYHALLGLLGIYFSIIFFIGLILECWALYNLLHYGRNERRTRQPAPLSFEEQARHFGVASDKLIQWQAGRRIILEHDENGVLLDGRIEEINRQAT